MKAYLCVTTIVFLVAGAVSPAAAEDRRIFLNGVELTGIDLRNQRFEAATVRFDASGDLHITAKGFDIKKQPVSKRATPPEPARTGGAPETPARPADLAGGRFYVIARPADGNVASPYRISVYLNKQLVDVFEPTGSPIAVDVTEHVRAGKNQVRFVARPAQPRKGTRRSSSPEDRVEIVLGQGSLKKGTVMIRASLLEYARNASETRRFDDTYSFRVR